MKIMITGVTGQLGYDIYRELISRGYDKNDIYAPAHSDLDIVNKEDVLTKVKAFNPDIIFHCAAYTAVDKAEEEKDLCNAINAVGTENIVDAASITNAKVVYISTDYIFDGKKEGLYETYDESNPVNVYGLSKLNGENIVKGYDKHFIVRISWVFGENGKNFIKTMLKLSETHDELNVVSDQEGSPTYTADLAPLLVNMANTSLYGTYHATNRGFITWYELAKMTFKIAGKEVKVNPILTKDYKTLAKRPLNSKLSKTSLVEAGFELLPEVEDAVKRYVKIINK
ncbi:MAG: dTDP-4-dehydrorhamnose reductase [Bacilli bacterium]|nr:dTDP-4-dehydrorhamnose reductase [Bacilli bacterium]